MAEVVQVTPRELKRRLDAGEPLALLDVREDEERAYCALPAPPPAGDLHVPMNQIPASLDAVRDAAGAGPLVIYCHHGVRSMVVANWLATRGLEGLQNLEGGIDAWSTQVDPRVPRY